MNEGRCGREIVIDPDAVLLWGVGRPAVQISFALYLTLHVCFTVLFHCGNEHHLLAVCYKVRRYKLLLCSGAAIQFDALRSKAGAVNSP